MYGLGVKALLGELVKASVGQTDVQGFEPHLGHNWLLRFGPITFTVSCEVPAH